MLMNLKVRRGETADDLAHHVAGTLWARARWDLKLASPVHLPYGRLFRAVRRRIGPAVRESDRPGCIRLDVPAGWPEFTADLAQAVLRATERSRPVTPLTVLSAINDSIGTRLVEEGAGPGEGVPLPGDRREAAGPVAVTT